MGFFISIVLTSLVKEAIVGREHLTQKTTLNIFIVHENPIVAASMLCNIHCNSQIRESAQMLANCFSPELLSVAPYTQKGTPRKYSHWNHPCSIWTRKSKSNMQWLIDHAIELENQRLKRGMNPHFVFSFLIWCRDNIRYSYISEGPLTEFAVAIAEDKNCRKLPDFNSFTIVGKYRSYICLDKPFAVWKNAPEPEWIKEFK